MMDPAIASESVSHVVYGAPMAAGCIAEGVEPQQQFGDVLPSRGEGAPLSVVVVTGSSWRRVGSGVIGVTTFI